MYILFEVEPHDDLAYPYKSFAPAKQCYLRVMGISGSPVRNEVNKLGELIPSKMEYDLM